MRSWRLTARVAKCVDNETLRFAHARSLRETKCYNFFHVQFVVLSTQFRLKCPHIRLESPSFRSPKVGAQSREARQGDSVRLFVRPEHPVIKSRYVQVVIQYKVTLSNVICYRHRPGIQYPDSSFVTLSVQNPCRPPEIPPSP